MSVNGRVVLIGETQVGKTSLIQRFLRGQCGTEQKSTIGAVFHTHEMELDGHRVTMQLWDTAGQERYRALGPIYYRKSNAAIAVFDLTRRDTLQALDEWIRSFRENADDMFVVIAGNKCDLDAKVEFTVEETTEWADKVGAECIWTSAQTGIGVEDLFNAVFKHLVESNTTVDEGTKTVQLSMTQPTEEKKCC